jgi:hypothetical protein
VAVVVVVVVVAVAAGAYLFLWDDEPGSDAADGVPDPDSLPVAPLTGLPLDDQEAAARPALVVKIDDSERALGSQAGLNAADVVYSELVEGGATRLAAVFHSTDASAVGPVRSARTSDIDLVANLNRPLFAYSGANGAVLRMVADADLVDVGHDKLPASYAERGTGVLRLFLDTTDFFPLAPEPAAPPQPLFTYRPEGEAAEGGEATEGVSVDYGGGVRTIVRYDRTASGWERTQDARAHVDADGVRVTPTNVVVQFTEYRDSGFVDTTGAMSPEAVLVGEGEAWVLSGETLTEARWSRPNPGAATLYTDRSGRPITLAPGRTWVELAPPGSAMRLGGGDAG